MGTKKFQLETTKNRILHSAQTLFELYGYEAVTMKKIACAANVSLSTIYSHFNRKTGLVKALMEEAFPSRHFNIFVEQSIIEKCPKARLRISAKMARRINDAEIHQMDLFRGAAVLAPELKKSKKEREMRRYERQKITVKAMIEENSLSKQLDEKKARDIHWALTGRDLYRMLVIERGWSSDEYEKWLADLLAQTLVEFNYSSSNHFFIDI